MLRERWPGKLPLRSIPPLRCACGPPVHVVTGDHGFPGPTLPRTPLPVRPVILSAPLLFCPAFSPGPPVPSSRPVLPVGLCNSPVRERGSDKNSQEKDRFKDEETGRGNEKTLKKRVGSETRKRNKEMRERNKETRKRDKGTGQGEELCAIIAKELLNLR